MISCVCKQNCRFIKINSIAIMCLYCTCMYITIIIIKIIIIIIILQINQNNNNNILLSEDFSRYVNGIQAGSS